MMTALSTTRPGGTTPWALGNNPTEIKGPPAFSIQLERGVQGITRNHAMWSGRSEGVRRPWIRSTAPQNLTTTSWGGLSASLFEASSPTGSMWPKVRTFRWPRVRTFGWPLTTDLPIIPAAANNSGQPPILIIPRRFG